jgi:hypothetical protein
VPVRKAPNGSGRPIAPRTIARMSEPDPIVVEARAWLRDHLDGLILFEGEARPIRLVVAPDGRLVASVMVAMLRSLDVVLALPDEDEDSMQLMVTLVGFEEDGPDGALADRWRIHHGEPPDVRWAAITIDAARFRGHFLDGEAFDLRNPLAAEEAAICSTANRDLTSELRAMAIAEAHRRNRPPSDWGLDAPRLVGADSTGFDLRGAYGNLRVPVEPPIADAAAALAAIRRLGS